MMYPSNFFSDWDRCSADRFECTLLAKVWEDGEVVDLKYIPLPTSVSEKDAAFVRNYYPWMG